MEERNTWPGWNCVRQIGSGSFGKVYEIEREEFGRTYKAALKVITVPQNESDLQHAYDEGVDEQSVIDYFRGLVESIKNEFVIMSQMKGYTNIVSYEDHIVISYEDRVRWDILIRMELLTPIQQWAKEHPLSENDVIKLGCDICHALEICQRRNIIHRDIKPDNIFVNEFMDYKLGDFGVARTAEQAVSNLSKKGTYNYMAPEVYLGKPYGATVDIYSLGTVLYRFLNENRTPFLPLGPIKFTDKEEALTKRMSGLPIPPPAHGSEVLKRVILKATAFDPKDRFQTPTEFLHALEGCMEMGGKSQPESMEESQPAAPQPARVVPAQVPTLIQADMGNAKRREEEKEKAQKAEQDFELYLYERRAAEAQKKKKIRNVCIVVAIVVLVVGVTVFAKKPSQSKHEEQEVEKQEVAKQETTKQEKEEDEILRGELSFYSPSEIFLPGDTFEMPVYVGTKLVDSDSKHVRWSSDNISVAKATDGVLHAIGRGKAGITCYYGDKKVTQKVIVAEMEEGKYTLEADKKSISLAPGESETIAFYFAGEGTDYVNVLHYNLDLLGIAATWSVWDGNEISLTITADNIDEKQSGELKVILFDANDETRVFDMEPIKIMINE